MASQKATASAKAVGAARPPERLLGLLRQHERLLGDVRRKRKAYQRAREDVDRIAAEVNRRLQPLFEESRRLDAELHALFAELLRGNRLAKRARRAVARFYAELQRGGVLSDGPGPGAGDGRASSPEFEEDFPDDDDQGAPGDRGDGPRSSRSRRAAAADVPAAAPPAASATLRGLFLRLARALHPDRARDAREQAARTETMKELNRAYREGDVARLTELERLVTAQGGFAGSNESRGPAGPDPERPGDDVDGSDVEERCAALEQTNQALRQQLNMLRRDLRALRDSQMGRLATDMERRRERGGKGDPFAELDADAADEVARFRAFRDHVRAFRDGSIALEDLLMGPLEGPDEDDGWDDQDLADFGDGPVGRRGRPAPAASKRGRGRRR